MTRLMVACCAILFLAFLAAGPTHGASTCRVYRTDGTVLCEASCSDPALPVPFCHGNALGGGSCSCVASPAKSTVAASGSGSGIGFIHVELYDISCKVQPCAPTLESFIDVPVTTGETPLALTQDIAARLAAALPSGCSVEAVQGIGGPAFRMTCDDFMPKWRLCGPGADERGTCPDTLANDPDAGVQLAGFHFQTDEALPTTGIPIDHSVSVPLGLSINPPVPNPFNPRVQITCTFEGHNHVTITVHDVAGRKVRTLLSATELQPDSRSVIWDGRDDNGAPAASGIYFFVLAAGAETRTVKGALLR